MLKLLMWYVWFAYFIYVVFDNKVMLYASVPITIIIFTPFITSVYKDFKLFRQYEKISLYSIWLYDNRHGHPDYGSYRMQFNIYHSEIDNDDEVLRFGDSLTTAYLKTNKYVYALSDGKIRSEPGSAKYDYGRNYIPCVTMDMSLEECQSRIKWEEIHETVMGNYFK